VRGSYGGIVGVGNEAIFRIWIKVEKLDSALVGRGAEITDVATHTEAFAGTKSSRNVARPAKPLTREAGSLMGNGARPEPSGLHDEIMVGVRSWFARTTGPEF
jgi:hypothetical protein